MTHLDHLLIIIFIYRFLINSELHNTHGVLRERALQGRERELKLLTKFC